LAVGLVKHDAAAGEAVHDRRRSAAIAVDGKMVGSERID